MQAAAAAACSPHSAATRPPNRLPAHCTAGLLSSLTSTFTDLGLDVVRAEIGGKGGNFHDTFWVTTADGRKVRRHRPLWVLRT